MLGWTDLVCSTFPKASHVHAKTAWAAKQLRYLARRRDGHLIKIILFRRRLDRPRLLCISKGQVHAKTA